MKTIEWAYSYGVELQEARRPTEEELSHFNPECRPFMLYGTGAHIPMEHIRSDDFVRQYQMEGRHRYEFPGCGNMAFEISDEEWDAFIVLNEQREAEKSEEQRQSEIRECRELIRRANRQRDIPTAEEVKRRQSAWNDVCNEGGEGYVPTWVTAESVARAKRRLIELGDTEEGAE